jgi:predicted ArsR family transcriptional regulator
MNTKQIHIPDWKEKRRYRALELKRADWTHEDVTDALGVSTRAVSRWMKAVREEGKAGLAAQHSIADRPGHRTGLLRLKAAALGTISSPKIVEPLTKLAHDELLEVRMAALDALSRFKSQEAYDGIVESLVDAETEVRKKAAQILAHRLDERFKKLLSRNLDGKHPWIDPLEPISKSQLNRGSKELKLPMEEVHDLYEHLNEALGGRLNLSWQIQKADQQADQEDHSSGSE